ncbi:MAG: hypothetical protein ACYDA0_11790 [Candidatus Dormibacteraceae bacterium]
MIAEFRATHGQLSGPMAGRSLLILTTTGARSGRAVLRQVRLPVLERPQLRAVAVDARCHLVPILSLDPPIRHVT